MSKGPAIAGLFFLLGGTLALAQGDAKRGEYLAKAGGCIGCHTDARKDAQPYAGGRELKTPFGTFYGPNITPHPQAGIGRWSYNDFVTAVREGRRPDGANYFPAFPYPSFTRIGDADLRDLWAYLRTLKPSPQPSRPHELGLLYRWRVALYPWKWLFFTPGPFRPDPGKSALVNRGAYLAQALGHCGECHTPRGIVGEMELSRSFTGFALGRVAAPDITPAGLAARGWTAAALVDFLGRGLARQGSAFSDMHPVIMLSTRNLTPADLDAVATYLLGDSPPAPASLAAPDPADVAADVNGAGRISYVALCAGCHGLEGNGMPNTVVAMRNNSTLRLADPRNLIVAMLDGIGAENFPHRQSMQAMPGFADKLSDAEAAALANYLRVTWGGQKGDVTADAVRALR